MVKYAIATKVKASILYDEKVVKVLISDNGVGFDRAGKWRAIGFANICNRASLLKGEMQVVATPATGCTVNVVSPTL